MRPLKHGEDMIALDVASLAGVLRRSLVAEPLNDTDIRLISVVKTRAELDPRRRDFEKVALVGALERAIRRIGFEQSPDDAIRQAITILVNTNRTLRPKREDHHDRR